MEAPVIIVQQSSEIKECEKEHWICVTCGVQIAASEQSPDGCPICMDSRQNDGVGGQQWTTLDRMRTQWYLNAFVEQEQELTAVATPPSFAHGQHGLLVR
jgi:hypothetical protein